MSQYQEECIKDIIDHIGVITPFRAQLQRLEGDDSNYDLNCGTLPLSKEGKWHNPYTMWEGTSADQWQGREMVRPLQKKA